MSIPVRRLIGRSLLGITLGIAGLWLSLAGVDLALLSATLAHVRPGWLALAVASVAATLVAKALRWRALFPPTAAQPAVGTILVSLLLGQVANVILPIRSGELLRAVHVTRQSGQRFGAAVGTIVAEKMIDGVITVGLAIAVFGLAVATRALASVPARFGWPLILASMGSLGLVLFVWRSRRGHAAARRWLPATVAEQLAAGVAVFQGLGKPGYWARIITWSAVIWALMASTNALVFSALGLDIPLVAALVLLLTLQGTIAIPSALGRPGVFLLITTATLGHYGITSTASVAAGIWIFVVVSIPPIVGSALLLPTRPGLASWRQAATQAVAEPGEASAP